MARKKRVKKTKEERQARGKKVRGGIADGVTSLMNELTGSSKKDVAMSTQYSGREIVVRAQPKYKKSVEPNFNRNIFFGFLVVAGFAVAKSKKLI